MMKLHGALCAVAIAAGCGGPRRSVPEPSAAAAVVDVAPDPPPAAPRPGAVDQLVAADPELRAALALFRASHGQPWGPDQNPAVRAAQVVFTRLPLVGMSATELERWLGPADQSRPPTTDSDGRVRRRVIYYRHNGELGAVREFTLVDDHVDAMRVIMTQ